ncbi:serine protease snake-like [Planococcus citri]|uniref:serine protease snake-like n=1 Tax=Planococcus citri TaxID=170843 RepID=UPI0031F7E484
MSKFWIIFCVVLELSQDAHLSRNASYRFCRESDQRCVLLAECSNSRSLITSKQAELCGSEEEIDESQAICCNLTNIAESVALQKCQEYSKYRYEQKGKADEPSLTARIIGGTPTQISEYPHMALIGFEIKLDEYNLTFVEWNCGGSLISENFVLSAAHCVHESRGPPRWVLLGDPNVPTTVEDAKSNVYEIIKIHDHPNYNVSSLYHDISLFELNTNVTFSPYVRPACLYTSTTDLPINTRASITGWGRIGETEAFSNRLLKATINVVDHENCRTSFEGTTRKLARGYDSEAMICAGDVDTGRDVCTGDGGGPLQISISKQPGMWNIIGVSSFGPSICGNHEDPSVYTKVSHYLLWIRSIVWPQWRSQGVYGAGF